MDVSGKNVLLPSEGISAAANLFELIVESELKGNIMLFTIVFFTLCCILCWYINLLYPPWIAASASAFSDDDTNNYPQASIAGKLLTSWIMIKFVHIDIIVVATLVISGITVIAFLFCSHVFTLCSYGWEIELICSNCSSSSGGHDPSCHQTFLGAYYDASSGTLLTLPSC